jgi:hypothetical protein
LVLRGRVRTRLLILFLSPGHSSSRVILVNSDVFNAQVPFSQRAFERWQSRRQQSVRFLTLDVNLCSHRPLIQDGVYLQGTQSAGSKLYMHFRAVGSVTERRRPHNFARAAVVILPGG